MKLGETDPAARRIGPLRAVDDNGDPVTDFSAPGAVEIRVNGGAFAAAAGTVEVIGGGYVYYQATAPDASARGFVVVKLAVVCQESTFREEIELAPQGIPVGTEDADELHVGPLRLVDENGEALSDIVGVDVEVSINGSAWDVPAGELTLVDDGYADYAPDPSEAAAAGWIAVKVSGACQEVVFRSTVVSATAGGAPTITIVSPTPGVAPGQPGGFPANRDAAIRTPIVLRVIGVDGGLASILVVAQFFGSQADLDAELNGVETTVFRRGSFRGKHTRGSTAVMDGDDIVLTIFREGGWQGQFIKFDFDGVETGG